MSDEVNIYMIFFLLLSWIKVQFPAKWYKLLFLGWKILCFPPGSFFVERKPQNYTSEKWTCPLFCLNKKNWLWVIVLSIFVKASIDVKCSWPSSNYLSHDECEYRNWVSILKSSIWFYSLPRKSQSWILATAEQIKITMKLIDYGWVPQKHGDFAL